MFQYHVDLSDFTWPELMVLMHHLQYAADRLRQEMVNLRYAQRNRYFYPQKPKAQWQGVLISHWAGLIRDKRYFTFLAQAIEGVINDWAGVLFISDGSPPQLDLSELQVRNNQPFIYFLERELQRARLATSYLEAETFDERVKQDLLLALNVEIRFFSRLLERFNLLSLPSPTIGSRPDEDRVPLLFVSLPKTSLSLEAARPVSRRANRQLEAI